ncbi:class F sortase [Arthrobacter agilis]|uniref:class F sortase n=1 Tax=Arthrobacter agilis TaxID=37921 RepID=UPI0027844376|nr:class F sortase [Arthrobacter agilis]MDQ0736362.1 LPXTG-site transpeptidase (sortase) family protein [Arthrobacter agilis]
MHTPRLAARLAALSIVTAVIGGCSLPPAESTVPAAPILAPTPPTEGAAVPREPGVPAPPAAAGLAAEIPVRTADAAVRPPLPPPVSLDVPGTDISVRVIDVGIGEDDAMEIPDSFWEAGWYRYGPAPGAEAGHAVIAAHVDSQTEVMPFARLKDVDPGTIITVGLADGRTLQYRVDDVRNVPKATFDGSEIFRRDGPHQLKIVTCGGRWLLDKGDYEDNVVLTASPL